MTTAQIILCLCGALTVALGVYAYRRDFGAQVEYDTESILKDIAEYRTYLANQYMQLVLFWLEVPPDCEPLIKLTTPGPNENVILIAYEDLRIETHFNWPFDEMTVRAAYQVEDRHTEFRKTFSMPGKCLDEGKLFKFFSKIKKDYFQLFELSPEDVLALVKQIALVSNGAPRDKEYFYDKVAGLILALRGVKRLRNNSLVMKSFAGIINYIWTTDKEGFLECLGISEEDFLKMDDENPKN